MILHRYQQVADALGLSILQLETQIGVKRGRISKAIERNAKVVLEIVEMITTKFPEIDRDWLLTGSGSISPKPSSAKGFMAIDKDVPTNGMAEMMYKVIGELSELKMR